MKMESTLDTCEKKYIKTEPIIEDVCSICSETFRSHERILGDEDLLEQLTFLIVTINISALRHTVMCKICSEKIRNAYEFKKQYVNNFCKAVPEIKKENDTDISCICTLCKNIVTTSLSVLLPEYIKKAKIIINYLTDGLDFDTSKDSCICISCQESMSNFHSIMNVLSIYDDNRFEPNVMNLPRNLLCDEPSNTEQEIKIKQEPSTENLRATCESSTINNMMQDEDIKVSLQIEMNKDELRRRKYEEFILKNEELDLKMDFKEGCSSEHENITKNVEESSTNEGMWKHLEEYKRSLSNLATEYLDMNYGNNTLLQNNTNKTKTFSCDVCGFKTKYSCSLKRHITCHRQYDESEMLTCNICDYKTKHKAHLNQHLITHKTIDETETFPCDFCPYKVKRKGNLKKHVLLIHGNVDNMEMFKCEHCEYKAKTKNNLKQHMSIHKNFNEIEIFTCDICGHRTRTKGNLKQHSLIHKNITELELFKCDVCDYKAKRKGHLQSHMLTHKSVDEIVMFKCDTCEYQAKRKDILKLHMLNHKNLDDIKTFGCYNCNYRTKRKGHLRSHMLTHNNNIEIKKMFKCRHCDYKTRKKPHLKIHRLTHKNDTVTKKMFKCSLCLYKTRRKAYLKSHILIHNQTN